MIGTLILLAFLGFIASVGLGPVTVLVIKRGMERGLSYAWISGIGAGLVDSLYGSVAYFGIQTFIDLINQHQGYIRMGMGAVLAIISAFLWLQNNRIRLESPAKSPKSWTGGFFGSFLLALGNPMMVLVYLGIFTIIPLKSFALVNGNSLLVFLALVTGTGLWWALISLLSSRFSERISQLWMARLNQIAAILMLILALFSGISGMIQLQT